MRRLSSARLPLVLNAARQPPLSRRPLSLSFLNPSSTSSLSTKSTPSTTTYPATNRLSRNSILPLTSKRHCSYRRMCGTRRAEELSGSTTIQGREVLPTNVKPVHYDLTLEPDFEKFTYDGSVVIEYVTFFFVLS